MPRDSRLALLILVAYLAALAVAVAAVDAGSSSSTSHARTLGYGQVRFDGLGPERWAQRARRARRRVAVLELELRAVRRAVLARPDVVEAINLAAATYGYGSTLWRKALCETGGTLSPTAVNRRSLASGLFQFIPTTWSSTPYARFSPTSAYANALAAGWMHANGRGGEWVCR
jgi:hypothetical protein